LVLFALTIPDASFNISPVQQSNQVVDTTDAKPDPLKKSEDTLCHMPPIGIPLGFWDVLTFRVAFVGAGESISIQVESKETNDRDIE